MIYQYILYVYVLSAAKLQKLLAVPKFSK